MQIDFKVFGYALVNYEDAWIFSCKSDLICTYSWTFGAVMNNGGNFVNIIPDSLRYLMQTLIEYAVQYCTATNLQFIAINLKNVSLEYCNDSIDVAIHLRFAKSKFRSRHVPFSTRIEKFLIIPSCKYSYLQTRKYHDETSA